MDPRTSPTVAVTVVGMSMPTSASEEDDDDEEEELTTKAQRKEEARCSKDMFDEEAKAAPRGVHVRAEGMQRLAQRMEKKVAKDKQAAEQAEFEGLKGFKLGMPKFHSLRRANDYERLKTSAPTGHEKTTLWPNTIFVEGEYYLVRGTASSVRVSFAKTEHWHPLLYTNPPGVSLHRLELKKQMRYFFRAKTFCVLQKKCLGKTFAKQPAVADNTRADNTRANQPADGTPSLQGSYDT
jgi:hypothetical protein